jgi:formiminotetrahydrofolate cyclodeaminase
METDQGFDLHNALEALATADTAQAGGSAAAFVGAIAAAVTVKVARLSGQEGVSAQALSLRSRLAGLAPTDAEAFAEARKALAVGEGGGDVRRDFQLGLVLNRASAVPLEIAEACADVSALAAELARTGEADAQPDAAVAAVLAAAAAHAAVRLVEVNLALGTDDPRIARARAVAKTASAAAEYVPGGPGT